MTTTTTLLDPTDRTTQLAAGGTLFLLLLGFFFLQSTAWVKWLRRRIYQYEVTFALYMLTPTERFIFNSILFLTLSLLLLACIVYLPSHIATVWRRGYYYLAGEAVSYVKNVKTGLRMVSASASASASAVAEASSLPLDAAAVTAAVVQETVVGS